MCLCLTTRLCCLASVFAEMFHTILSDSEQIYKKHSAYYDILHI